MSAPELVPPVPFASVLYSRMLALEARIRDSWRGVGTDDDVRALAEITARVDALEEEAGPGGAWTALDEAYARSAAKGVAHISAEHLAHLRECYQRAGVPMPAGYKVRSDGQHSRRGKRRRQAQGGTSP